MERTFTFPAQLVWRCCFVRCFRERAFTYPVNDFLDTVGHAGSHGLSIVLHARGPICCTVAPGILLER